EGLGGGETLVGALEPAYGGPAVRRHQGVVVSVVGQRQLVFDVAVDVRRGSLVHRRHQGGEVGVGDRRLGGHDDYVAREMCAPRTDFRPRRSHFAVTGTRWAALVPVCEDSRPEPRWLTPPPSPTRPWPTPSRCPPTRCASRAPQPPHTH